MSADDIWYREYLSVAARLDKARDDLDAVREELSQAIFRNGFLRADIAAERERGDRLAQENNDLKIQLAKWINHWRTKETADE